MYTNMHIHTYVLCNEKICIYYIYISHIYIYVSLFSSLSLSRCLPLFLSFSISSSLSLSFSLPLALSLSLSPSLLNPTTDALADMRSRGDIQDRVSIPLDSTIHVLATVDISVAAFYTLLISSALALLLTRRQRHILVVVGGGQTHSAQGQGESSLAFSPSLPPSFSLSLDTYIYIKIYICM